MRPGPQIYEIYAKRCARLAATAHDSRLKPLFSALAYQWRELAVTARLLEADAQAVDESLHILRTTAWATGQSEAGRDRVLQ